MSGNRLPSKRIRYYSLLDGSGYGTSAFGYIEALEEQGFEIIWSPMEWTRYGMAPWEMLPDSMRSSLTETSERQNQFAKTIGSSKDYDTVILHTMPEVYPKLIEQGKRNIGYTVWETDKLPLHWPACIKVLDHLMVPCKNNQELFNIENGPKVSVVPHMIEFKNNLKQNQRKKNFRANYQINENDFVFYTINSWSPRKAMRETVMCYLNAFNNKDNVCLIVKTDEVGPELVGGILHTSRTTRSMIDEMKAPFDNPAKIVLIDKPISQDEIMQLHLASDCYYSLTHSEGWGLGAYGAASLGKPVIITGWGGQTDYLPNQHSYLVDYTLENVVELLNCESYTVDQRWAHARPNHAVKLLKHVYNNPDEAKNYGKQLAEHIAIEFSDKEITDQLIDVIYSNSDHAR